MGQQFHVVIVRGREVEHVLLPSGNPVVFADAMQALKYAEEMSFVTGHKYQPRPVPCDIDWRKREQERMHSGHYTKLPWHKEAWVNDNPACEHHYPHVSKNDSRLIAYTADETKALQDVHSVAKPSKYLITFYGKILNEKTIHEWTAKYRKLHDKENVLHFAYTADEIEKVYKTGPQSCMKCPPLRSNIHPVRAYAGPDLAVAYVKRNRVPTARAVVWPERKLHGRIYGDEALLKMLLEEEGYEHNTLEGARLTKIKQGNRYICPYIDYVKRVKVGRKYLYISSKGVRAAANQDGFCGAGFRCAFCEPVYCEHDSQKAGARGPNVEGVVCCDVCYAQMRHNEILRKCSFSGFEFRHGNMTQTTEGMWIGNRYLNEASFTCQECKKLWHRKNMIYKGHGVSCKDCYYPQREMPF